MYRRIERDSVGRLSGLFYLLIMGIGIPLLIFNDPSFSTNFSHFDPLSKLSQTSASKNYYKALHVLSGIMALIYFEFHFFPQRIIYGKLNNWNLSRVSARVGSIGQIATGIFVRGMFPLHLFSAAAFAGGYVSCFVFISFNLDNQLIKKGKINKLIVFGYLASFVAMMNILYFRYSSIRGIWQFFVIIVGLSWYVFEAIMYRKNSKFLENNIVNYSEVSEISGASYLMIGFGIYLFVFGFLLYAMPKMWPWKCTENDETCQLPNVISLIVAGSILILYSLHSQLQIKQKIKSTASL
ncbi:MAG: hypothetical protein GPJ54_21375 [Candidatus Heimdallarchaeota archaeon]|nr:hypothetical protein [Candidatus Heimdallarchaeota archaeon]